jgi:hypothetical protein
MNSVSWNHKAITHNNLRTTDEWNKLIISNLNGKQMPFKYSAKLSEKLTTKERKWLTMNPTWD